MFPFDPRGANEAGFPWEEDYARLNPAYFDLADRRIGRLVARGLLPCIVGAWGYFIEYDDPWIVDFELLSGSHSPVQSESVPATVSALAKAAARNPRLPALIGETNYEGILGGNWEYQQRLMFWTSVLSGAAGHNYGASGVWEVSTRAQPYGHSPQLMDERWADIPWQEAYGSPGQAYSAHPWEDSYRFAGSDPTAQAIGASPTRSGGHRRYVRTGSW